jgi:hypothetical protein
MIGTSTPIAASAEPESISIAGGFVRRNTAHTGSPLAIPSKLSPNFR